MSQNIDVTLNRLMNNRTTNNRTILIICVQGSHRLEKYLSLEGLHEKSLKVKYALKSTGKSLKCLEKSMNSTIFCRN